MAERETERETKHICPVCGKRYLRGGERFNNHVADCRAGLTAEAKALMKVPHELLPDRGELIAAECRQRAKNIRELAADMIKKANRLDEIAEEVVRL